MNDPQDRDDQSLLGWLMFNPAAMQRRQDRLRLPAPRRASRRRLPEPSPPKPGSIAAAIYKIEGCGAHASQQRAARWATQLFMPQEVEAWLSAGLRTGDLDLVVELRSFGVPPEAMDWVVRRETMLDRVRLRNYSARAIAEMLRREHLLGKASA